MTVLQVWRIASKALVRNKMRSFLTLLGVIIGVAAVIAMVAIGEGAQAHVEDAVHRGGMDPDADFARARLRIGHVLIFEDVGRAVFMDHDGLHCD